MAWKLLRFTSLKPFFFGKQKVFTNTNYASSEYFPQQTQLLGALRSYLLETQGHLKVHKHGKFCAKDEAENANRLAGTANSSDFAINDDLGRIDFISPMFILKKLDNSTLSAYFPIPSDIVQEKKKNFLFATPKKATSIVSNRQTVLLQNYDVKKGFESGFGDCQFWKNYIENSKILPFIDESEIFTTYEQVGIELEEYGKKVKEEKFYTKKSYMLKPSFEFGVLVNLRDETEISSGIFTLGAETSTFKLAVEDIPSYLKEHPIINLFTDPPEKQDGKKLVLVSDAMLENSLQEESYYQIISSKVPFKMMTTSDDKMKQSHQKTELKSLVAKGSIYYYDNDTLFPKAKGAYKKMGFNQYLAIK